MVRKDLKPGAQLAQSCHVCFRFSQDHPHLMSKWMEESEYICILSVENEVELVELLSRARELDIPSSYFVESDFDDSLTAIALAPGPFSKELCSKLKLALRE